MIGEKKHQRTNLIVGRFRHCCSERAGRRVNSRILDMACEFAMSRRNAKVMHSCLMPDMRAMRRTLHYEPVEAFSVANPEAARKNNFFG